MNRTRQLYFEKVLVNIVDKDNLICQFFGISFIIVIGSLNSLILLLQWCSLLYYFFFFMKYILGTVALAGMSGCTLR